MVGTVTTNAQQGMRFPTLLLLVLSSTVLTAASAEAQLLRRRVVMYDDPYYYGTWTYPAKYYSSSAFVVPATIPPMSQAVIGPGGTVSTPTSNYAPAITNGPGQTIVPTSSTVVTYPGIVYCNNYTINYYYSSSYAWPAGSYYYPFGRVGFRWRW